jgi:DNA adenine methylase
MKPPFRWAGSKKQLVRRLASYWNGGRYIEPFAGSACLFFEIEPRRGILGDLNWELFCTLHTLQTKARRVLDVLSTLPRGKRAYYSIRKWEPKRMRSHEVAARFLYLNRYCFNGLYRTNMSGRFNVPYCPPERSVIFDEKSILQAARLLRHAEILHGDFENTLSKARHGDFVYLDPPYAVSARRVFSEYMPGSFGAHDLSRLGSSLSALDKKGVSFVITYADSLEARKLLRAWSPIRIQTRRNIAGFTGNRRISYELLATNCKVVNP